MPVRADAELIEKKQWNVPIWNQQKGYPLWETLSKDQQRWEFLRRTPAFRKDWENYSKPGKFRGNNPLGYVARKYNISQAHPPQLTYENLPSDFKFYDRRKPGGDLIYPRPLQATLLADKEESGKKLEWSESDYLRREREELHELTPPTLRYDPRAWIEFDLTENLEDQLANARTHIESLKAETKEYLGSWPVKPGEDNPFKHILAAINESSKFPRGPKQKLKNGHHPDVLLLRVMDGINCGRKPSKIALTLADLTGAPMDEKTVREQYKNAIKRWQG